MNKYTFICDKLVRDKDPQLMKERGIEAKTRQIEGSEYVAYLKKKVREEAIEIEEGTTPEEVINELIDVYEAGEALKKALGLSEGEFLRKAKEKREKKGGFESRTLLCSVTLPDAHPELRHYRQHPHKYLEKTED